MKVKIKDLTFEIIEEDDGENVTKLNEEGDSILGRTSYFDQRLYVHKNLSSELKKKTLAHELTHAYMFAYGFNGRTLDEEAVCDLVSNIYRDVTKIVDDYFMNGGD